MTRDHTLADYDADAVPDAAQTITIAHVDEPHDVYGGRGPHGREFGNCLPTTKGWLGNPYTLEDRTREEAIDAFDDYFESVLRDYKHGKRLTTALVALCGKVVACHCREKHETQPACHLDVVRERLLDGTVFQIASEYQIPLEDWQVKKIGYTDQ